MTPENRPFDLRSAAKEFYRDFPDMRRKVFFLQSGGDDEFAAALARLPAKVGQVFGPNRELEEVYEGRIAGYAGVSGGMALVILPAPVSESGVSYRDMLLRHFSRASPLQKARLPEAAEALPPGDGFHNDRYWSQFFFDHEASHAALVLRNPDLPYQWEKPHFETQADLYAMMRHYQREGTATGFDRALIEFRAQPLLYRINEHATALPLHRLQDARDARDWRAMNAGQCLARSMAMLGEMHGGTTERHTLMYMARQGNAALEEKGFVGAVEAFARAAVQYRRNLPSGAALDTLNAARDLYRLDARGAAAVSAAIEAVEKGDARPLDDAPVFRTASLQP